RALSRSGIRPRPFADDRASAKELSRAHLIVDALLGTGSRGAAEGGISRAIELINTSGRPVVALDIPSGLSANTGAHAGAVIKATMTLTFAGLKRGLVTAPGAELAGRVSVIPIGVPDHEVARGVTTFLLDPGAVAPHFPRRSRATHKGTYGHLLLVAGSLGKTGAAALSALSAMRSGTGLVTVAVPASQQPVVASLVLEAMTETLPETSARTLALRARVDEVQRDRIETVREFATRHRVHIVLKGARSVIGAPDGRVFVNPTGNPGMASGGTGDVLTGMLGAFLARGLEPGAALRASVYLHGSAGDIAAERLGEEALIARDVIAGIP